MSFVELTVDTKKFEDSMIDVRNHFYRMTQTLIRIHYLIERNTRQRVPLDTSRLEHSFHFKLVDKSPQYVEITNIYDAVDPNSHFHYAEYQHEEDLDHPRRGEQFYLMNGIHASEKEMRVMIETDYLSLFKGGFI